MQCNCPSLFVKKDPGVNIVIDSVNPTVLEQCLFVKYFKKNILLKKIPPISYRVSYNFI
jgi:hypothetical protein